MITSNLPVLIVIVPLLAGVATPLLGGRGRAWWIAMLTATALPGLAVALLLQVRASPAGVVSYPLGNWRIPWGIEYRVDALNAFVLLIVTLIAAAVTFYARLSVAREVPADRLHFFYAVWLLCLTGLLGVTVTGDAFNLYVLLEIASLATYTLVAMGKNHDRRALTASINYLVLGTIGAGFILLGIGYLYMVTGTLNMADMSARLADIYAQWDQGSMVYRRTILTAIALLTVGFGIKFALFPLHGWLPNAHAYAPTIVSAFLPTALKVAAYGAIRFFFTIIGIKLCFQELPTDEILLVLSSFGIICCSYLAIRQVNIKRMMAYSSVAQIGYIALGFALANPAGLTGALIHLFNHALIKGGLFLALGAVAYRLGAVNITTLRGLGRKMPLTMAAFTAGGLGLVGVPLTAGFISKWYLVSGAIKGGHPVLAGVVLLGSLLALVYVWRVVEVIYFQPAAESAAEVKEAPLSLLLPTWILIGGSIYFGIDANLTSRLASEAARMLLGVSL